MPLASFQQRLLANNKLWGAGTGTSDLPASNAVFAPGTFTVGDLVLNQSGTIGQPAFWQVTAVNSSGTPTFTPIATEGSAVRTVSPPATITATDSFVNSPAGALTLAPTAGFTVGKVVTIHATASSVTITPTSGTINGAVAVTLAANANAQLATDGVNWFQYN